MHKVTINGKTIDVPPGTTIIKACQMAGIPIAHYCWHEGLSVAGACRMCMVEVEKMPKLQIACNTPVNDGMVVRTDSDKVKEAVRWQLDFHLINHPLDCPICDQAGECKLQDYYMAYGKYTPEMNQHKQKKHKVVSLGERVVLDQERCILCSRCVRFTHEVTKTHELGIFNRGDRSELSTFENRPMNNNYSVNTVDICPVGALTSKDFRFKQRVWFLKDFDTICNGCSTGCNITVSYNTNGVFRVRPRRNDEVNGFWMCDQGRDIYKHTNKEFRLESENLAQPVQEIARQLRDTASKDQSSVAVVMTGQYTNEEYDSFFDVLKGKLKIDQFYHWKNNEDKFEAFDGLLRRGDLNPNTAGLLKSAKDHGVKLGTLKEFEALASSGRLKMTLVAGPEDQGVYFDFDQKVDSMKKAGDVAWLTSCKNEKLNGVKWQIPMKSFVEKDGSFTNYKGIEQKIKAGFKIVPGAISLIEFAKGLSETLGVNP